LRAVGTGFKYRSRQLLDMDTDSSERAQRGIQSVEVGSEILRALTTSSDPMTLKDLATAAGMPPAKVFPYLVSLQKLELVQRVDGGGEYCPGPLALRLGLFGLQRVNPIREAESDVLDLAARTGQSVALTVWGPNGPVVVRLEEPAFALHLALRVGTLLSLVNTATGRLFGAYMQESQVRAQLNDEGARLSGAKNLKSSDLKNLFEEFAATRDEGMTRAVGNPLPGVNALAAPVFSYNGTVALGITLIGPAGTFDTSWDGQLANALRETASELSYRLGFPKANN
jgi:DNA-binding IclR family transcriptional regulator